MAMSVETNLYVCILIKKLKHFPRNWVTCITFHRAQGTQVRKINNTFRAILLLQKCIDVGNLRAF